MPLDDDGERRWAYYVPRPLPAATVASIRDLTILDPAVGSGHFLVVAFDLLLALHREEASHRGQSDRDEWSDRAIVERIVEHNLRGIDLDPRVTRIASAALWLKARRTYPGATPGRLNLVASDLRLAALPDDDPALAMLRRAVERDTGVRPTSRAAVSGCMEHHGYGLNIGPADNFFSDRRDRWPPAAAETGCGNA